MLFMPKEVKFFDLFDKQAENLLEGAQLLNRIINTPEINRDNVDKMHAREQHVDEIC